MKTFISAADIELLAEQGVRELTVDEDTVLTAIARETAGQLGIRLLAPGATKSSSGEGANRPGAPERPGLSGSKPKGCQHGPIALGGSPQPAASGSSPVVDELIGAVKQLARVPSTR